MRDIEKNAVRARAFHFRVDRARHDVARRERSLRMIARHKIFAAIVAQDSTFAPDSFGNEERFRLGVKQTGRMELDEFHVRDHRARAPRHRDTVASRDIRIGRVEINFPATAGGEHDSIGADCFDFA